MEVSMRPKNHAIVQKFIRKSYKYTHSLSPPLSISRNRLPNHFDDLSYWSDIFLWREQHFKSIIKAYDGTSHGEQVLYQYYSLCII